VITDYTAVIDLTRAGAHGKSDPLDAYSAARSPLSGAAALVPKLCNGRVEAIRALRVARSSARALFVTEAWHLRKQQKFRSAFHKLLAPTWFGCQGFE